MKKMFLLDAIGALVSILLLGLILPYFQEFHGMPLRVLYLLALIPVGYAVYSFYCFFCLKEHHAKYLRGIAYANLCYCFLTMGLMLYFFGELTWLGVVYFVLEMVAIVTLVVIELKVAEKGEV